MAKLKGTIQFTGNLDGISFYEMDGKVIVRKTGGFDGKAIKKQDNYIRTRENATEFGNSSVAGKQLRHALALYVKKVKTASLHSRLSGVLTRVLKCDAISERGKRTVALGLATPEGREVLKGFECNPVLPLHHIIAAPYRVLMAEGKVVYDTISIDMVAFPAAATHLSLQFLLLRFDFENGTFILNEGGKVLIAKEDSLPDLELTAFVPEGNGVLIGLVFGEFLQEVSGVFYVLEKCGLKVVGVE